MSATIFQKGSQPTRGPPINRPVAVVYFALVSLQQYRWIYIFIKNILRPNLGIFFIKIPADHPHSLPLMTRPQRYSAASNINKIAAKLIAV